MKKVIGAIILLLSIAFLGILALRIWNIEVVSMQTIIRSSATLFILGIAIFVLLVGYGFFFNENPEKYDKTVGNKAHPKL
ncbi:MAG: hypothetical protein EOO87_06200 [Pedobacter sp.]|nr:MAG: hypothetical protein EOO87_06200 [Pedobacter sp.]